MDVIKILSEYLDVGVDAEEMVELARTALIGHIKALKGAIANSVINARSQTLLDNLEGSNKALAEARKFKKQLHHFTAELKRLDTTLVIPDDDMEEEASVNGKAAGVSSE